jgi:leader peptidase (prepilin peptidase)/N-methyltransferase
VYYQIFIAAMILAFFGVLTCAVWSDLSERRIPNQLNVCGAVIALLFACSNGFIAFDEPLDVPLPWIAGFGSVGLTAALVGGAVCFTATLILWCLRAVGGGDVKLAFVIGAFLGWQDGLSVLLWSQLLAAMALILWYGTSQLWTFAGLQPAYARKFDGVSGSVAQRGQLSLPMAPFFAAGGIITVFGGGVI